MIARLSLALLGLTAVACVAPPTRYELASSAETDAEHVCCLHPEGREVEPWGREMLGAERVNREYQARRVTPAPRAALDLDAASAPPGTVEPATSAAPASVPAAESAHELERTRQALAVAQRALDETSQHEQELAARIATLNAELEQRTDENQALAARLVQAQIRRLEAEKLLLENQIEAERTRLALGKK